MEIVPFTSIGVLKFGDSRQEARAKLASEFSTFRKYDSVVETDAFDELELHLYYDNKDYLEFVEAFEPAEVTFRGVSFLGRDLVSVVSNMSSIGFAPTQGDDINIKFDDIGIALTAPSGVVETVAAHRRGYFEQ